MFPHRDKKAKQTKVAQEEKEVPSEEENSKEKEKALRGWPFCDSSEKSTNSGNLVKVKEKMPHHSINFQSSMTICVQTISQMPGCILMNILAVI